MLAVHEDLGVLVRLVLVARATQAYPAVGPRNPERERDGLVRCSRLIADLDGVVVALVHRREALDGAAATVAVGTFATTVADIDGVHDTGPPRTAVPRPYGTRVDARW